MKKLIFILLFIITLTGCNAFLTPSERFERLTFPVIVVAESKEGVVTVRDINNTYITLGKEFYLAQTLSATYNPGDTIR